MTNAPSQPRTEPQRQGHGRPLQGTWDNQLGSELVLEDDGEGGLTGTYRSATGANSDTTYLVRGCYDLLTHGPCRVLGFVVNWGEHQTVTSWSGRFHQEEETIRATWVMTTESDEVDEWRSTFVGHDTFRRRSPASPSAGTGT